jgi:RHS repeat-associated protein/uncharacterized repeat protein (TIGR01451 family)
MLTNSWLNRSTFLLKPSDRRGRRKTFRPVLETLEDRLAPATFTVLNTNDSGAGSLRQAILDANITAVPDLITFNIPGTGVHTIAPTSALPTIEQPVDIDGYTQPGSSPNTNGPGLGDNAVLRIELDGSNAGSANGLDLNLFFNTESSLVRGLAINRFGGVGLAVGARSNSVQVQGNFIGTDVSGTLDRGNGTSGIDVGGSGNTIGGTLPAMRNVISGNGGIGISFGSGIFGSASGNLVQGNFIGTNVTGIGALANQSGITIGRGGSDNRIGGLTAAERNVISGNNFDGIGDSGGGNTTVQGNFIGTQVDGVRPLGNGRVGVGVDNGGGGDTIGGTTSGAGNVIAFNGNGSGFNEEGFGVLLARTGNVSVLGNSIFGNVRLGIESTFSLAAPVLTSVLGSDRNLRVQGTLDSAANTSFRIEFFANDAADPSGFGEGQTFIGATMVLTDAAGHVQFAAIFPIGLAIGKLVTATATPSGQSTSEFSLAVPGRVDELRLGETVSGTITGPQDRYFRVDVPAATDVFLTARFNLLQGVQVFVRYADVPNRSDFDQVASNLLQLNHEILLTGAAGPYFILLHGTTVDAVRAFDLTATARTNVFEVRSVSPKRGSNVGQATTTLIGSGFSLDTSVSLIAGDGSLRTATQVTLKDGNTLFATFDLTGLAPGVYDVRIDDQGRTATASESYTVTEGTPGRLELRFFSPRRVRIFTTIPGTEFEETVSGPVTVSYANVGDTDIPAPLLEITASGGRFILPGREGDTVQSVQVLGLNGDGPAGVLTPGAKGRITLNWQAGPRLERVDFHLSIIAGAPFETSLAAPIDWNAVKDSMRPALMPADAWDAIFANFTARVGTTRGQYMNLLDENATYLGRLGQTTSDINRLLGFIFQQADNAFPQRALASAVDAAAPAAGLPLMFNRTYLQSITSRYALGEFGRGWTHNWDLSVQPDGPRNFRIQTPGGSRSFRKQGSGTFQGVPGDTGIFTRGVDFYSLREADGTIMMFRLSDGKLSLIQDPNGNSITLNYVDGLLTSLVHSDGDRFTIDYNVQKRISQLTDQAGRITTYSYDVSGEHLLSATGPGGTIAYTYESGSGAAREHALRSITNPDATHFFYDYDALGRLVRQERDGGVGAITSAYDSAGGVTIIDATGATRTLFFNDAGRLGETRDALGRIHRFSYEANGRLVRALAPENLADLYRYDSRGNLTNVIDSLGRETAQTFDPTFNRILTFNDALLIKTGYSYDARGNLTAIGHVDGTAEQFSYDAAGNLIQSLNRRGQDIDYTYDSRGLLIRKDHADGAHEDFTFDNRGNLLTATDAQGTTAFTYDVDDRLTRVLYPTGRSLDYTYDAGGRRTQMVDQDGFEVHYAYDAAGRLARLTDAAGALIVGYTYDPAGRLAREDKGNGTFTTYEHDAGGQLLHLVNHAGDGSVNSRFDHTYNDLGLRTSMTTLDGITTYGYDALGQLTSVALPGGRTIAYAYDAVGNRLNVTDAGAVTNYTANDLQQYLAVGSAARAYDADGNLIRDTVGGQISTYAYDDENRLVTVVTPAGTWDYEYDSLGNRIAAIENGLRTEYLLDPTGLGNVAGEYAATGSLTANYVHGLGLTSRLDAAGQAAFYDFDAIGSTAGLTGQSGNYVNTYSYLPFGEQLSASEGIANPFRYVGQFGVIHEGNGLDFMRARYFSPTEGRFINEDPIGILGGVNLYSYVGNQPASLIDPFGLSGFDPSEITDVFRRSGTEVMRNPGAAAAALAAAAARAAAAEAAAGVLAAALAPFVLTNPGLIPDALTALTKPLNDLGNDLANDINEFLGLPPGSPPIPPQPLSPLSPFLFPDTFPPGECVVFCSPTDVVSSLDPNDIIGPAGFGADGFIRPDQTLPYTITFENRSTATAPAQTVVITQQLDPDLDFTTFEVGELRFGTLFINGPGGQNFFSTRVDLRDTLGLFVDIDAGIDTTTGIVTWTFTAIDPATQEIPIDPGVGFLPPNVTSPEGEGFVTYTIRPRSALVTGTRLDAQARINFDTNAPIDTSAIFNTIDAGVPTSNVGSLPATINSASFGLSWPGQDDAGGSGIVSYDVFVSDNGGPDTLFRDNTTATSGVFRGLPGHLYSFYSIATDGVGHEQTNFTPVTTIIGGVLGIKHAFTDDDGDTYTLSLTGPGQMQFLPDDLDLNGNGPIGLVVLQNTDPAKSKLTVKVKKGLTGDGRVSIGSIEGTGVKSIKAAASNLIVGIDLTGPLGNLKIRDTLAGATIRATGTPAQKTSITAHAIGDNVTFNLGTPISSFTAAAMGAGSINAPSIGKLTIKGDAKNKVGTVLTPIVGNFEADLTLTGTGTGDPKKPIALGTARITGDVTDSDWNVTGGIRSITAKNWTGGSITAASLGALSIKGNFTGDLTLTGAGVPVGRPVLRSATVGRRVEGSTIQVMGSVNNFTAGQLVNSSLLVAYTPTNPGDIFAGGTFVADARLLRFRVRGVEGVVEPAFDNSFVAATSFGTVFIDSVNASNAGTKFGLLADLGIDGLTVRTPGLKLKQIGVSPDLDPAFGDFEVRVS